MLPIIFKVNDAYISKRHQLVSLVLMKTYSVLREVGNGFLSVAFNPYPANVDNMTSSYQC